jgi:hypothetical protein
MKLQIEDCRLKIVELRCRMVPEADCRIPLVADDRIVSDAEELDAA